MSIWIKICANTTLADAELAVAAGADAVGFVFAPSPRQVTVEQVGRIAPRLPTSVEKIGVFVEAELAAIAEAIEHCQLTGVQLHSLADAELARVLRRRFGRELKILQVVPFSQDAAAQVAELKADRDLDAILVDSRTATAVGGTGIAFDWQQARRTIFADQAGLRLIAAGGLNPSTVAEAIRVLRPWGVDVASGVEVAPGRKDPKKIRAFIEAARASVAKIL